MIGIIYQLTDNKIISIIPDVLEVTETSIKGADVEMRGIDTSQAGIKVITPFAVTEEGKITLVDGGPEYGEGDQVDPAALTDIRAQLPKTKDQEIADLEARLQAAETDNLNTMLALTEVYEMIIGGA